MRMLPVCLCAVLLLASVAARPQLAAESREEAELQKALHKIDEVSRSFRTFSAKFTQKKYVAILKEFDAAESGDFYYALAKDRSVMMRHEVLTPGKIITTIKGSSATRYEPAVKQARVYNLGKSKNLVQYLATGLGQSSARLKEQFTIRYQGSESIQEAPCSVLVFVPKNPSAAASVQSITIWFKKSTGTPAQYKFQEPTGDYLLETFAQETLNSKIPDAKFEQKFPRGVEILTF